MKPTFVILTLSSSLLFAQGPFARPGAPAPTMKTLTQVEPRTAIENLPFTISTPGNYYFTQNLQFTATTGNAIEITTGSVTLDLGGFTLSSTAAVTGTAIFVSNDLNNIAIKNGIIAGNTTVTIAGTPRVWTITPAGFSNGVFYTSSVARNMTVEHLQVSGCRSSGMTANYGRVTRSTANSNGTNGLVANNGSVTHSAVTSNGFSGITAASGSVSNSTANSNGTYGISASSGSVSKSNASSNGTNGIIAGSGSVTNSTTSSNGSFGISAGGGSITSCIANANGTFGISADNGTVTYSTARTNGSFGISATNGNVASCTAADNGTFGILAGGGSVTSCNAKSNNTTAAAGVFDLNATNATVSFTKYGTGDVTGTTLTGNKTP